MLDSALTMKTEYEKNNDFSKEEAIGMLEKSELVSNLLISPKQRPDTFVGLRSIEWRLLELSEIPYTYELEKVQKWIKILVDKSYIGEGFSLSGEKNGLLACHNAIITTILIKMNYNEKDKINAGIKWILDHQSVARGQKCEWTGEDLFVRFGGCMKEVPCFFGVVKSMIALTEYKKRFGSSKELDEKLSQGLEYILKHRVYKRISSDKPIKSSIVQNFYPYTYKSNIIEILTLLKANGLYSDNRCKDAIDILKKKQRSDGYWQADVSYMKTGWVDFDEVKKPGLWITYIISKLIKE